jgi:hypothetical protein
MTPPPPWRMRPPLLAAPLTTATPGLPPTQRRAGPPGRSTTWEHSPDPLGPSVVRTGVVPCARPPLPLPPPALPCPALPCPVLPCLSRSATSVAVRGPLPCFRRLPRCSISWGNGEAPGGEGGEGATAAALALAVPRETRLTSPGVSPVMTGCALQRSRPSPPPSTPRPPVYNKPGPLPVPMRLRSRSLVVDTKFRI